jgi:phage terminase large subunit
MSSFDGALHVYDEQGNEILFPGPNSTKVPFYGAQPYQQAAHASTAANLLCWGPRGTGKSKWLRMDAILRCLMFPGFHALIVRRTMPQLKKSHLKFIKREAELLGGSYNQTSFRATFPHPGGEDSTLVFTHCENEKDLLDLLSAEYGFIGFDELSTFSLQQFLLFSASARAPEGSGYVEVIRASSNPLGPGAEWMQQWFITHEVDLAEYPDYNPKDFEDRFWAFEENKFINQARYKARLGNLPEHVRKAWLDGEFVVQGTYFTDFRKTLRDPDTKKQYPWHVIPVLPTLDNRPITSIPWINVYRAIDWGYFPDPAVCLWFAVLPNKRAIAFKERHWHKTLAGDVAKEIREESEGLHIAESFCDPTMHFKEGQEYSIGDIFERNGVPVTASINDRVLFGYSIHEYLNTIIDEKPQLQIVEYACPNLIKTIPTMKMDPDDPRKMADGNDHWVVATAYFCMGQAPPSHDPIRPAIPKWMQPKRKIRAY